MAIKIILPKGEGAKTGWGTKVIDIETGNEIKGISRIELSITPALVSALIHIPVEEIEGEINSVAESSFR